MNHNQDILVVGDELSNVCLLTELLEGAGYQVRSAETPQRALDSARELPPGLILLDVRMPQMDGFEVYRQLKKHPVTSHVPVIFTSSLADADAVIRGFSEGAVDFITAPFLEQEVVARVKIHMRFHRLQQHLEQMVEERTSELKRSEARFRGIMQQSPLDIVIMSPEGQIVDVNAAWMRNWDVQPADVDKIFAVYNMRTDKQYSDLGYDRLVEKAFGGENVILPPLYYIPEREFDEGIKAKSRWIQTHMYPVKDEDGNVLYVVCTILDVTEQKKAIEKLQESESRSRAIMEQSPLAMEILAPDGQILHVNDAWKRLWGLSEEEAKDVLQHYNMLTDKESEARGVMPLIKKAFAGERVTLPVIKYDAQHVAVNIGLDQLNVKTVWIQCHLSPVFNEDGEIQCIVNAYVDLTEKTKAQQERNRILKLSPDLVCIVDMDNGMRYTNPAWKHVLGYSEEELLGKFIVDFIHPDDKAKTQEKRDVFFGGEALYDFEIRCLAKDGTVRHITWSCTSVPEENLIFCDGRDITDRKKMELEAREQRDALARVERTTSMGQLAGSITHELNQPLTGILSNAQAAEMMLGNDRWDREELLETLADIVADTKRAGNVMRSLRDIYREQKGEFAPIEVNLLIKEALELMHGEFVMKDIHLNVQNAPSEIRVDGNRVQLQQVLVNLLMNGAEAMCHLAREDRCLEVGVARVAGEVKVWVDDDGTGIDADKIENIFEPLATWKPGGTGMGLAISDSIIHAHGGKMWAQNRSEGGVRVGFSLPVPARSAH